MRSILILITLLAFNSFAKEETKRIAPQFQLISSEEQSDLQSNEAIYQFKIKYATEDIKTANIRYSIDDLESEVVLNDFTFEVKTTPGKHQFKIYINNKYLEMYSGLLAIKAKHKSEYNVFVRANYENIEIIVDKPIIYLYPEIEQKVTVLVDPVGEFSFTYPEYKEGWNITVQPDGTIEHEGRTYNYLFWESKQTINASDIAPHGGFIVEKEDIVGFLEEKLSEAGFTSKEKADFITYWGPRMVQFDEVLVEFIQNSKCDQFAKLHIQPKPDHVNRFYMSWAEYHGGMVVLPQTIEKINRTGFDGLEWGGHQLILGEIPESL